MAKDSQPLFKCGNELNVTISKFDGETIMNEDCCTVVGILLKNTGEIATSFLGAHNPEVIKVLEKTLKVYFKAIKKTLKKEFKEEEDDVKVVNEDIPSENKWNGEDVPDKEGIEKGDNEIVSDGMNATTNKKTPAMRIAKKGPSKKKTTPPNKSSDNK